MKRRFTLDDNDLIMVVDKDVVKQIDETRGEMNRTEFVNFLIHSQLKACYKNTSYISKEEFYYVVQEIKVLLGDLIKFVCTLAIGKQAPKNDFRKFIQKVKTLGSSGSVE